MGQQVDNWRKSSKSANGGEQCVEVGTASASIAVRDTQDRAGAVLTVPADAWKKFTAALR
jgi:Domain of unknown function (DUF397)